MLSEPILNKTGINCISVAHILLETLGAQLPPYFDSVHMLLDRMYLKFVDHNPYQVGDIIFAAPEGIKEFRIMSQAISEQPHLRREFVKKYPGPHVAVCVGTDSHNEPWFIHATYVEKRVTFWRLRDFKNTNRYEKIYAHKRIRSSTGNIL